MKISNMVRSGVALLLLSTAAVPAFAGDQKRENVQPQSQRGDYVWVTGSRIPQRVKLSAIGTPTFSALSVWDRRQINRTGRGTTEGVLKQDPSVSVILGHGGGR